MVKDPEKGRYDILVFIQRIKYEIGTILWQFIFFKIVLDTILIVIRDLLFFKKFKYLCDERGLAITRFSDNKKLIKLEYIFGLQFPCRTKNIYLRWLIVRQIIEGIVTLVILRD
ncbi:hypothetical protein D3C85_1265530 [compost metagenome]